MNIFLTGYNGFIGSYLAKRLSHDGHYITIHPSSAEIIIHLAAHNNIRCEFDPKLIESNIVYAKEMLTTPHRTIFASSTSAAELNNPYAYTKRYGEYLCSLHPNALALRLFNVYGHGCKRGIVKALIEAAYSGKEIEIQSGAQIRDFIYVEDVCDIIMQNLTGRTGVMDAGTGKGTSIEILVSMICDITRKTISVRTADFVSGQQLHSIAEPLSGYSYTPLYHGLVKTVMAYKKENGVC